MYIRVITSALCAAKGKQLCIHCRYLLTCTLYILIYIYSIHIYYAQLVTHTILSTLSPTPILRLFVLNALLGNLIIGILCDRFIIGLVGCKWTIPVCMIGYALYMAANFYAVIWLMTIAGVILGFGAAPMWSAKCTYLTQLGVWYSRMTGQSEDAIINRFFGFFFMMFQTSESL